MAATSEGLVAFLLHFQGRKKFSRLTTGKRPQSVSANYIFPELGKSCHMETARSSSLHWKLLDTGAELKLKPFGSQNSQISNENLILSTPKAWQPNLFKEKGPRVSGGSASGRCTKRYPLLLLLSKLGAAVTIALHPAPSRRRSLCSYRAQASSKLAEASVPRSSPS